MKVVYSKAIVSMTKMRSKYGELDMISGKLIIQGDEIALRIENFSDIGKAFGITTHKLLCAGLVEFTKQNNIGDDRDNIQTSVTIPLRQYALLCGYAVREKDEFDKERVKNLLKIVKKQTKKDLKILLQSSLKWEESTRGQKDDYDMPILIDGEIKNGNICMTFNKDFAKYLKHRRITVFPEKLFSVDSRKANAYRIGQALAFNYYNKNNQEAGNFNKMKVKTLLKYTCLPTIETVRTERTGTWKARMMKPLEKILNELVQKGIISSWECRQQDDSVLSADQKFPYEVWENSLIYFDCIDDEKPSESVSESVQAEHTYSDEDKLQTAENPSDSVHITTKPRQADRAESPSNDIHTSQKPKKEPRSKNKDNLFLRKPSLNLEALQRLKE